MGTASAALNNVMISRSSLVYPDRYLPCAFHDVETTELLTVHSDSIFRRYIFGIAIEVMEQFVASGKTTEFFSSPKNSGLLILLIIVICFYVTSIS